MHILDDFLVRAGLQGNHQLIGLSVLLEGLEVVCHLIGGALAAVLVGPWVATLCLTVVLLVQALVFADGGLTALGTNVVLMAIVGVWVGWAVFAAARRVLPARTGSVPVAASVGALVSVPAAASVPAW